MLNYTCKNIQNSQHRWAVWVYSEILLEDIRTTEHIRPQKAAIIWENWVGKRMPDCVKSYMTCYICLILNRLQFVKRSHLIRAKKHRKSWNDCTNECECVIEERPTMPAQFTWTRTRSCWAMYCVWLFLKSLKGWTI